LLHNPVMRFAPTYGLVVMMLALANGHIGQNTSRFRENILTIIKQEIQELQVPIMAQIADIAIVSFDRFINGSDAEKRAVAKQLYEAFSTVGWVYVKDHGIPQERVDEIFGLVRFNSICIVSNI
jgi:hypothetical protein